MSLINWIHNLNHSNLFHHTFGQANGELAAFPQWNHCCGRAGTWRWTGQFGDQVTSIGPIVFDKLIESGEHFLCPHVVVRRGGTLFDQIVFHLVVLLVPDGTNETWLAQGMCLLWMFVIVPINRDSVCIETEYRCGCCNYSATTYPIQCEHYSWNHYTKLTCR